MKNLCKELYVFYCHSIQMNGDSYKLHGLGGSESALIYMAQEIARCGKEVVVFCKTDQPGTYDGVRYERIEKFLSFIQFTIIDVFISVRCADIFLQTIKARLRVLWVHDAADQPHVMYLTDERVRKNIDYYITLSEWQRKGLIKKFKLPAEKIFQSRNGVNRAYYRVIRDKRRKRLVYTSTPFRGLEILLELFPDIRKQIPDAELYVYSSMEVYGISREEDHERFGEIYENCKRPGIKLIRSLPQKQLARELMKAQLLVYPNIFHETSCIAALEAQAAGLPVVASRRGALEETVVDRITGTLIDGDVMTDEFRQEFVNAVVRLLKDEKTWKRASHNARKRILEQYCWDTIAPEWIRFFDSTRPTLSLCMIVKDEEKNIARTINSVKPIVDEIVVVDTGSTDKTKSVARSLGAHVYDFTWCDDFAAARNFSLSKATSEWILVLDADEIISKKDLGLVRRLINVSDANAYLFFQRSYLDDTTVVGWKPNRREYEEGKDHGGYFDSPLTRLFRNHLGFAFKGKVHEIVEYSILAQKKTIINTDIPIHHFGKVMSTEKIIKKGQMYLEIGKTRIKEHPHDPRSYYDLGAQYFELGILSEAKKYYRQALEYDPDYYRALCDLGMIHAKEKEYDAAIESLERTIAINPRYTSAYTNLGIVYELCGRIDDAIAVLKKALAIDAQNITAYKNLGVLYFSQDKHHEALECFRKMRKLDARVSLNFEHAQASYKVGVLYMEQKEFSRAKKYFEESIRVLPSFALAYNKLGIVYVNGGDISRAEEQFKKAIELLEMDAKNQKECARAYSNLGFIYNNKGLFNKALQFLEKALEIDPSNPEIYNHIGIAKCGRGALADGITFFKMALELSPNHQAAAVNLKRVNEVLVQERNYKASIPKE